jgi:hypothetical protein
MKRVVSSQKVLEFIIYYYHTDIHFIEKNQKLQF